MIGLRIVGSMLLVAAGVGGGFAAASHLRVHQVQIHNFARLLRYLAELLESQSLVGVELLSRAANCAEYAQFCPEGAEALSQLIPPRSLPDFLQQELHTALAVAEESPRKTVCSALHRLSALCEEEAGAQAAHCRTILRLWPRLGGCLGAMAAILLW